MQRVLLAALLISPNQVVSSDRLFDALWDEEPPETAQTALHVHVSGLRRTLGKDRVQTKAPGYLLRVEPGERDLDRFQSLWAEGKPADALALWRGPPFADVANRRFARREVARLEELRLSCLEDRIERDLESGRDAELIGELESLVGEHPFRERLRGQLMLALYRSGRQAEALDAYQDARRDLVGQLGIEPGRSLRELHRKILAQDSELETAADESPPEPIVTRVLTFLTSAVEGPATDLWDTEPGAMASSLAHLDESIGGVVEARGGYLLPAMSEDRSRVSVFESPAAAVRAATDAADALADAAWPDGAPMRARFGLHTGEAQGDAERYHGTAVTLAARICGEADGGEILLSETTAALVAASLGAEYAIVDLGRFRLEGIGRPESIKALVGPGLATTPTAIESPYRGLLAFGPEDRHLFFGREEVLADMLARVAPGRLLAVVGASGSGKSSLLQAGVLAAALDGELVCARTARLLTPGAEPPLDLGDGEDDLLVVDQFEELYTQCRDSDRRVRFIEALLTRAGPVVIGVRADFYGELAADPALAAAVAGNQVLLGPMLDDGLRRAVVEPARLAGLRVDHGLVDVVLRDVAGEPGALPLMSHALRETWERRDGRTLTVEAYEESGGVSSALAQTADAVVADASAPDRALLRNVFLRLTEGGDDQEDTRRRARIDELIPEGSSEDAVRGVLERLVAARLVILDGRTAELAHEVLIRRWPTLRRWLDEDREGIRLHRRLGDAARLWETSGREPTDLYRGTRLDAAIEWARQNRALLNRTERDFLTASVDESARAQRSQVRINRRLRRALIASGSLLAATAALLTWALVQRSDAIRSSRQATSLALSTDATSLVGTNLASSLLLALNAYRADATPQARTAVTLALQTAGRSGADAILRSCGEVNDVAFGPGGETLAVGCYDGDAVVWDMAAGRPVGGPVTLSAGACDRVRGLALDPAGETLAVGCNNGNTVLWAIVARKPRGAPVTLPPGSACDSVNRVAFGPGALAVGCNNGNTVLWSASAGKPRGAPVTLAHGDSCDLVNDVAFARDGTTLAVGCNNGNTVLWGITPGNPRSNAVVLPSVSGCGVVNAASFDPDSRTLAVGCHNGETVLWEKPTATSRWTHVVLRSGRSCDAVYGVAFDGPMLAVGCGDGNTVLWEIDAGRPLHRPVTVPGGSSCDVIDGLAFGGGTVAVGCANGNTLLVPGVPAGTRDGPLTLAGKSCDAVNAVAFGGETLALACNNGNTVLSSVASGRTHGAVTIAGGSRCSQALAVGFDRAAERLAVGCAGKTVLWDIAKGRTRGKPVTLAGGGSCPKSLAVAFGSGGHTLAVGCNNGNTLLWDVSPSMVDDRPLILRSGDTCDVVYGVAFGAEAGTLAVGCFDGNTLLWDTAAGKPSASPVVLPPGNSCDAVYGVAFEPGTKTLALGCYNGNTVLWDVAAGKPRGSPITLPGGSSCDPLLGVTFGSGTGTLALSCRNGNAVLWNIAAGKPHGGPVILPAADGCSQVYGTAFDSRGGTLALGCGDGETTLWNVVPWPKDYASAQSRVCDFVWGDLTKAEWRTLAPGLHYEARCPED
jgi:DNA-binding SARP family transcriptional activator/WD40 repeat protein